MASFSGGGRKRDLTNATVVSAGGATVTAVSAAANSGAGVLCHSADVKAFSGAASYVNVGGASVVITDTTSGTSNFQGYGTVAQIFDTIFPPGVDIVVSGNARIWFEIL